MKKQSDHVVSGDIMMIDHFLKERGDIERWTRWKERKPVIEKEFPELINAMVNLDIAEKTLNRIVDNIIDNVHKYPDE